MRKLFNRFVREDEGQDLIEYALLAALISIVSIAAISAVGTALLGSLSKSADDINAAGS